MNEGAFDQNFTWYEWGFVSPDDVPHDDLRVSAEAKEVPAGAYGAMAHRLLDQWDENHRWPA